MFYKILELRYVNADLVVIRDVIHQDIYDQIRAMQMTAEAMGNREGLFDGPIKWEFDEEAKFYYGTDSTGTIQFIIE